LLIYFFGGGYCYDYNTCYNMRAQTAARGFFGLVSHLSGFTPAVPNNVTIIQDNNAASGNPFTDWTKVLVWYCTGDFHTGNHIAIYKDPAGNSHIIEHVGYANMQKFLSRLRATFCNGSGCTMPAPDRIVVAGSSAGGFGAVWNLEQIEKAFQVGDSNIQLIDDVGPYLRTPYWTAALQGKMAASWWGTSVSTIPEACANAGYDCDARLGGQFNALLEDLQHEMPSLRASLITGMADSVVSSGFSRQTYRPPDNQPPYAPAPCGSALAGDCLPDGYPGLEVRPAYRLFGYFCSAALPDYSANQPAAFKTFEITTQQRFRSSIYDPSYHQWLYNIPLDQVRAADGTLLSDFLLDQLNGTGVAWRDHAYTSAEAPTICRGWSF